MNVKEAAKKLGISEEQLFRNAYQRHGLLYSIGNDRETFPRWKKYGVIPIYVARYCKDAEKMGDSRQPVLL